MVIALTHHGGVRLAEIAFLLVVLAGLWLAAGQFSFIRFARARSVLAGLAFAVAGILLIIATHWGKFG